MELKFERLCQPFLLLFTNRYAGRAFEREEEADQGGGQLICKGLRSMWRQVRRGGWAGRRLAPSGEQHATRLL